MKPWKAYEVYEEQLPNHVFIQRVAAAAGVSTQSIHRVAKKRLAKEGKRDRKRLKGCPYTFVSLSLWDEYMEMGAITRVAKKPKGWVTAKALLGEGFSKRKLYQLAKDGDIKAVYLGNTLYFEPESASRYTQTRHDLRPPPGWVSVGELRQQAQRSKQALCTYLKRHNIATKQFLHPKRDQLVQYISQEDANCYLASLHKAHLDPQNNLAQSVKHPSEISTVVTYTTNALTSTTEPLSELASPPKETVLTQQSCPPATKTAPQAVRALVPATTASCLPAQFYLAFTEPYSVQNSQDDATY